MDFYIIFIVSFYWIVMLGFLMFLVHPAAEAARKQELRNNKTRTAIEHQSREERLTLAKRWWNALPNVPESTIADKKRHDKLVGAKMASVWRNDGSRPVEPVYFYEQPGSSKAFDDFVIGLHTGSAIVAWSDQMADLSVGLHNKEPISQYGLLYCMLFMRDSVDGNILHCVSIGCGDVPTHIGSWLHHTKLETAEWPQLIRAFENVIDSAIYILPTVVHILSQMAEKDQTATKTALEKCPKLTRLISLPVEKPNVYWRFSAAYERLCAALAKEPTDQAASKNHTV